MTTHTNTRRTSAIDIFVRTLREEERPIVKDYAYLPRERFNALHGGASVTNRVKERLSYFQNIVDLDEEPLKRELQKRIPRNGHYSPQ